MPKIDVDMFDEEPRVGDKVKVMGKVESINDDTGEVEVSYDDVKIVDEKKRKKRRDDGEDFVEDDTIALEMQRSPNMQTLDQAMANSFGNTQ